MKNNIFLKNPVHLQDLYTKTDHHKIFLGDRLGKCSSYCFWSQVGNNVCDLHCHNRECKFDLGDCTTTANVNDDIDSKKIINYRDLQHTYEILKIAYGANVYRVTQNVPVLIQKDIMNEMIVKFWKDIEKISRNKLPTKRDLDLSTLYNQYIVNENKNPNMLEIFNYFDVDKDRWIYVMTPSLSNVITNNLFSCWNDREMENVITILFNEDEELTNKFHSIYQACFEFVKLDENYAQIMRNVQEVSNFLSDDEEYII